MELDKGEFRLVKILAMADGIVHVRLYADESLGIQYLRVSTEDFATWRPGVIGHEDVRADELEGYEIRREAYEARTKPGLLGRR